MNPKETHQVTIKPEQVDDFNKKFQQFKDFTDMLVASKGQNQQILELITALEIKYAREYEQHPWLQFVHVLRLYGTGMAMHVTNETPKILQLMDDSLDPSLLQQLDVKVNEFQLVQILSEAAKVGVPLELVAGNGTSSFNFNGKLVHAVFRNPKQQQLVCVKLGVSQLPTLLRQMLQGKKINDSELMSCGIVELLEANDENISKVCLAFHSRQDNQQKIKEFLVQTKDDLRIFMDSSKIELSEFKEFMHRIDDKTGQKNRPESYLDDCRQLLEVVTKLRNKLREQASFDENTLTEFGRNTNELTAVDGIISLCLFESVADFIFDRATGSDQCASCVLSETGRSIVWGGTVGAEFSVPEMLASYETVRGWRAALAFVSQEIGCPEFVRLSQFVIFLPAFYTKFRWTEFVENLRKMSEIMTESGIEAAKQMIQKKAEIIKKLPDDQNHVLGIAFEELQIAKVLANAKNCGIDLELIAGDGLGQFNYRNQTLQSPEYTDAIFRIKGTDEFFAVQMKFTDTADNLLEMIEKSDAKWRGKKDMFKNHPEKLKYENVQMVGPGDIVGEMSEQQRSKFVNEIETGFKTRPFNRNFVEEFLNENTEFLKACIDDPDFERQVNDIKRAKKDIKRLEEKIDSLRKEIEKGGDQRKLDSMQQNRIESERSLRNKKLDADKSEKALRERLRKGLKTGNLEQEARRQGRGKRITSELKWNVGVQAAVDCIIAMVISGDSEIRRYCKGEISLKNCAEHVLKETAIACLRGSASSLIFTMPTICANYATVGSSSARALRSIAKYAGPVAMGGMIVYQAGHVLYEWNNGNITRAQMLRSLAHIGIINGLTALGTYAGFLIAGPIGLLVGAGITIAVALSDYYLWDKLMSIVAPEDPNKQRSLTEEQVKQLEQEVIDAAYKLFGLTEKATKEEVREAYKAAVLKYHPDKGGDNVTFQAVHSAYAVLRNAGRAN